MNLDTLDSMELMEYYAENKERLSTIKAAAAVKEIKRRARYLCGDLEETVDLLAIRRMPYKEAAELTGHGVYTLKRYIQCAAYVMDCADMEFDEKEISYLLDKRCPKGRGGIEDLEIEKERWLKRTMSFQIDSPEMRRIFMGTPTLRARRIKAYKQAVNEICRKWGKADESV